MNKTQLEPHVQWQAARNRVGTTLLDNLRWLLNWGFDQKPLGDRPHSQKEILDWQYNWSVFIDPQAGPDIGSPIVSEGVATEWEQNVRLGFRSFGRREPWKMSVITEYCVDRNGKKIFTVIAVSDEKDRIAKKILEVFDSVGDHIRFCQRSDCQKIFERKKGKRYCSSECAASKFRVRKHRLLKRLEKARAENHSS